MYFRFTMYPLLQIISLVCLIIDPKLLIICGILYILVALVCDGFFGENDETLDGNNVILNFLVYSTIPLHLAIILALLYQASNILSYPLQYVILIVATVGTYNAIMGIIIAHELSHKSNPLDFAISQFCLAFIFHSSAAIDHIYGHHNQVGFATDNTTSQRGENFWQYFPRAVFGINRFSLQYEKTRLERKGRNVISFSNRALVGNLFVVFITATAFLISGITGIILLVSCGIVGLLFLEAGNYISHYGIIRVKNGAIKPRHSWNNFNLISSSMHFNISRHSAHHMNARKSYWQLERLADVPTYPFGFAAMNFIALFPPLYFWIAKPELERWTNELASDGERKLVP